MLRTANNPLTEDVLLQALVPVLSVGTHLAAGSTSKTGVECCYVANKYALAQGAFPAVLLSSGVQEVARNSLSTYMGTLQVYVDYYDRWDTQPALTIDTIRADIALELERMASNVATYLTNNEGFLLNGIVYPTSLLTQQIGGYIKANDSSFPGMILGTRRLILTFALLPYRV